MIRPQLLGSLLVVLALAGAALVWHSVADAGGTKSDTKVKATATATKRNAKGQQTVTVTLVIDKGWHLYANPVNHEFLENAHTELKVSAKVKPVSVDVKYPRGKTKKDGKDTYNIYEDRVTIQANVQRAEGDTSPLQISIAVHACNDSFCLQQGTVKLTVP